MITKEHYTKENEHPEDRIYKDKEFVDRLNKLIDEVFNHLAEDLRLNKEGQEFLFNYVYNESAEFSFEEYLENMGLNYTDMVLPNEINETKNQV
jgi:hypothetical protein